MKKKMQKQEEGKQKNLNETPDNKENTDKQENGDGNILEIPGSGELVESKSEDINSEGIGTDKVVPEEMAGEEKLAEMQDKYIRLAAEFDNYRKRTLREKMELSKYACESLLLNIIPLMDDFERALKHIDSANDCAGVKNGIDLIYGKFSEFLKQNGIKEIESLNTDFNVDVHESVAKVPVSENNKKGKVVEVVSKGYYLKDKVLRFSKVIVGE